MTERILRGHAASPGLGAGPARLLDVAHTANAGVLPEAEREAEAVRALAALETAGSQIEAVAADLRARGSAQEAEIVETGALMAADPALAESVRAAVLERGCSAAVAVEDATGAYADTLASLDDPVLRLRADDVRSLGRRAARVAASEPESNGNASRMSRGDDVLVARDLGPADVAELGPGVKGVVLADGGVMAHAAIVARSLGIPMVVAVGDGVLALERGTPLVVDGGDGSVVIAPGRERRQRAQVAAAQRHRARERSAAARGLPAETPDGHRICVLANVAAAAEVAVAMGAGAEGVGLLRTELRFLDAHAWPGEEEHRRQLMPVLGCLSGVTATVRLLDFGGDKTPPFLAGTPERGIALLLAHPEALEAQLRAIVATGADTVLRVLLPMVEAPEQVQAVREMLAAAGAPAEARIGAMIETRSAVERAHEIAAVSDFLSIGTNDLTHSILVTNRFAPGGASTHHPDVVRAIAATAKAAEGAERIVEVCGEAASDRVTMPLLLGLGIQELSVGAARVGAVRGWVRALRYDNVQRAALAACEARSAAEVATLVEPLSALLGELDDAAGESVEGSPGVVALGGQT